MSESGGKSKTLEGGFSLSDINLADPNDEIGKFQPKSISEVAVSSSSNGTSSLPLSNIYVHEPKDLNNLIPDEEDYDSDFSVLDRELSGPMKHVEALQMSYNSFVKSHSSQIRFTALSILFFLFHGFLVAALIHNFDRAEALLYLTIFGWILALYYKVLKPKFGRDAERLFIGPMEAAANRLLQKTHVKITLCAILIGGIATFLFFDTMTDRSRLNGLMGMAFLIAFMFAFSADPSRIKWRPVISGFCLQFCFGLLILRWNWGAAKFQQLSSLIVTFLEFANYGTKFVYGFLVEPPNICGMQAVFAFTFLPVIIYFGAFVSVLFYFGIVQAVLKWLGWFMQITLGTTAPESLNACACVFLGIGESPFLIKPYLKKMTPSEIHAVMTSGFSCIAGSLFVAYIGFGACPTYLLSATIMSAPGSLACSKLLYPETKKSKLSKMEQLQIPRSKESNALECLSNGAIAAVEIVMAIIANIIVTLGIIAFINSIFGYLGSLIGYQNWKFESAVGFLFYPLAFLMGVTENSEETLLVGKLMGVKTVTNEFVAYQQLGQMISEGLLSPRSAMIATYALCGFSNFQTLGIVLAILGGMIPQRKALISSLALRALMGGAISCFMTASLAGVLIDTPINCPRFERPACFDVGKFNDAFGIFNSTVPGHNEL